LCFSTPFARETWYLSAQNNVHCSLGHFRLKWVALQTAIGFVGEVHAFFRHVSLAIFFVQRVANIHVTFAGSGSLSACEEFLAGVSCPVSLGAVEVHIMLTRAFAERVTILKIEPCSDL
jgi:hypothetical protein